MGEMREDTIEHFFFEQKTAYEVCGRDWSSDVCSSDLIDFPDFYGHFAYKFGFFVWTLLSLTANCRVMFAYVTDWNSNSTWSSFSLNSWDYRYVIVPTSADGISVLAPRFRPGSNEVGILIHEISPPRSCSSLTHHSVLMSISSRIRIT